MLKKFAIKLSLVSRTRLAAAASTIGTNKSNQNFNIAIFFICIFKFYLRRSSRPSIGTGSALSDLLSTLTWLTCWPEVDWRILFAGFGRTLTTDFGVKLLFEATSSSASELEQVFRSTSDSSALLSELQLDSNDLFFTTFEGFSWVDGVELSLTSTPIPVKYVI